MKKQTDFYKAMQELYSRCSRTLQPSELQQLLQTLKYNAQQ